MGLLSTMDAIPQRFPWAEGARTGEERVDSRVTKSRWAFAMNGQQLEVNTTVSIQSLASSFSMAYCNVLDGAQEYTTDVNKLRAVKEAHPPTWITVSAVRPPIFGLDQRDKLMQRHA